MIQVVKRVGGRTLLTKVDLMFGGTNGYAKKHLKRNGEECDSCVFDWELQWFLSRFRLSRNGFHFSERIQMS